MISYHRKKILIFPSFGGGSDAATIYVYGLLLFILFKTKCLEKRSFLSIFASIINNISI